MRWPPQFVGEAIEKRLAGFTQAELNVRYFNAVIEELYLSMDDWEEAARIEALICDTTKRLADDLGNP